MTRGQGRHPVPVEILVLGPTPDVEGFQRRKAAGTTRTQRLGQGPQIPSPELVREPEIAHVVEVRRSDDPLNRAAHLFQADFWDGMCVPPFGPAANEHIGSRGQAVHEPPAKLDVRNPLHPHRPLPFAAVAFQQCAGPRM